MVLTLAGAIYVISGYLANICTGECHFGILHLICQHQQACPDEKWAHTLLCLCWGLTVSQSMAATPASTNDSYHLALRLVQGPAPLTIPPQLSLPHQNRRQPTKGTPLECLVLCPSSTVPLSHTGYLLNKVNSSRLGELVDMSNVQKQTQKIWQDKDKEEYVPTERIKHNYRKMTKQNGDKQSIY